MDKHFVDACPRQNIPIVLSLIDFWNEAILHSNGRVSLDGALDSYGFVSAIENKVLNTSGKMATTSLNRVGGNGGPHPVIDGISNAWISAGCGSNPAPAEFITTLDPPILPGNDRASEDAFVSDHGRKICSLIARADTMAFGAGNVGAGARRFDSPGSPTFIPRNDSMISQSSTNGRDSEVNGNQPSSILVFEKFDAFTCGQLVALGEHRALIKAWLWDIDPFAATAKPSMQKKRQVYLSETLNHIHHELLTGEIWHADESELPDPMADIHTMNCATNMVLKQYATRLVHRL
jgi:glucose-6-phosphate isomerase